MARPAACQKTRLDDVIPELITSTASGCLSNEAVYTVSVRTLPFVCQLKSLIFCIALHLIDIPNFSAILVVLLVVVHKILSLPSFAFLHPDSPNLLQFFILLTLHLLQPCKKKAPIHLLRLAGFMILDSCKSSPIFLADPSAIDSVNRLNLLQQTSRLNFPTMSAISSLSTIILITLHF